ncbi:iron ABC transporter permease [Clostridium malenominatum]|uniref:Iron ABC transporter permease n=1 Tax=Clostridium malenominatum TaxID=1539 RepID=A0ABN1IXI2_9CLOT
MNNDLVIRKKKFSFLIEKRSLIIILSVILLAVFSILFSLSIGQKYIPLLEVIKTLLIKETSNISFIINNIRLPRTLVAFLVGASLALSGSIIQGIIKNPLADPNIIGIVDSGSVGALVFLTLFTDPKNNALTTSIFYMPLFTFIGAFSAALLVYFLAFNKGVTPNRLILIGLGISGAAKALTSILIINGPVVFIKEAQTWITGTVYGSNWTHVKLLFSWFSILLTITFIYIRQLNLQNLEDNISKGLGNSLEKNRFILLVLSAALASGTVAIGGGISFVGLIAPHISRKLTNSSFGNLVPISLLIGGIIVVLADIASRTLFFPLDLPVGIFTAAIGAPFFIYLLIKNQKSRGGL